MNPAAKAGDEEFVGYAFRGAPQRRPRLWFLDRLMFPLMVWGDHAVTGADEETGIWRASMATSSSTRSASIQAYRKCSHRVEGPAGTPPAADAVDDLTMQFYALVIPGVTIRYEHHGNEHWTAVWRLTDVHTFGRDDDVWRLGLWPD